jgi:hypothetical protein
MIIFKIQQVAIMSHGREMRLTHYSDDSCVVFGNIGSYKENLERMGGTFHTDLISRTPIMSSNGRETIGNNEKIECGMVFPKKQYEKIQNYLKTEQYISNMRKNRLRRAFNTMGAQ